MKFISVSFLAMLTTLCVMNPVLGMTACDLFKCDNDFKDCVAKECDPILGLKKKKSCIKKKCMYSYEDCQKNCKDTDDKEDDGPSKIKSFIQDLERVNPSPYFSP